MEDQWNDVILMPGLVSSRLPAEFCRLGQKEILQYFPYAMQPQMVWRYKESVLATFSALDKALSEPEVMNAVNEMERLYRKLYPESSVEDPAQLQSGKHTIGYFTFQSGSIKGETLHTMFLLSADNRFCFGGFHYPNSLRAEQRKIFRRFLSGIWIMEESVGDKRWNV